MTLQAKVAKPLQKLKWAQQQFSSYKMPDLSTALAFVLSSSLICSMSVAPQYVQSKIRMWKHGRVEECNLKPLIVNIECVSASSNQGAARRDVLA